MNWDLIKHQIIKFFCALIYGVLILFRLEEKLK